jgi:hypothetical protein
MLFAKSGRTAMSLAAGGLLLALAGCQSGGEGGAGGLFAGKPKEDAVRLSELRAYCPQVTLRSGTASFNTYAKGGKDDPAKIVYQASIADVTRKCSYTDTSIGMTVAVAGRVVPGPQGKAGTITMPIRVAVVQGDQTIYSKLFKHPVQVSDTAGATQFVFTDSEITIPGPVQQNVQVFAGFDEGPYNTP